MRTDDPPIPLFMYMCTTGEGTICGQQAYHMGFSHKLLGKGHPICRLEVVNAVAAHKTWAHQWKGCLVHLHTDNITAAAIFQLGKERYAYIQSCTRELWLI